MNKRKETPQLDRGSPQWNEDAPWSLWAGKPLSCLVLPEELFPLLLAALQCLLPFLCLLC